MLPQKPPRTKGFAHLFAATAYSKAGLQRLWQEPSFRQEVLVGFSGFALLALCGAPVLHLMVFLILVFALLAVEALNTAIEVIVDHLSPEWSVFAKQAKDIGSAAVFLMIVVNAIWFVTTLFVVISDKA